MEDLYFKYLEEREGMMAYCQPEGFITYKFIPEGCFIEDYYVLPEHRKKGVGYNLADKVLNLCVDKKVPYVFCQTDDKANGVDLSKLTIQKYGFKPFREDGSITLYMMEVSEWARQ